MSSDPAADKSSRSVPHPITVPSHTSPPDASASTSASSPANGPRHARTPSREKPFASPTDIKPKTTVARRMSLSSTPQSAALPEGVAERLLERSGLVGAAVISGVVIAGTIYSHLYCTALNTSLVSHLPERTHFFARKSNWVNQYGVKLSWLWTTLLYLSHLAVSPSSRSRVSLFSPEGHGSRLIAWVIATLCWAAFTSWCFGAGLGDRVIQMSGGSCAIALPREWGIDRTALEPLLPHGINRLFTTPSGEPGEEQWYLPVPSTFCVDRIPLDPSTHPSLFALLSQSSSKPIDDHLDATAQHPPLVLPRPRWHRGFDISGHIFLLTLASLLLVRELVPSWRRAVRSRFAPLMTGIPGGEKVGIPERGWMGAAHTIATLGGTGLLGLWVWMLLMTSVWFHNPPEKLMGLVAGLSAGLLVDTLTPSSDLSLAPSALPAISSTYRTRPRPVSRLSTVQEDENAARRGTVVDNGVINPTPLPSPSLDAVSGKAAEIGKEKVE